MGSLLNKVISFEVFELLLAFVTAVGASAGFWQYVMRKNIVNGSRDKLIMGLAHDRIVFLGTKYLEKGSVTQEEYDNLYEYLYLPYVEMGGNGFAKKLMEHVSKLPINTTPIRYAEEKRN